MDEHALEGFRRKEPLGKLVSEAYASLDHVLGYTTLRLDNPPEIEARILHIFGELDALWAQLGAIVPADDLGTRS